MTELVVIRHGETDLNRAGSFQGQIDIGLNEHGFEQARKLAQRLANESFDALYTSDLIRTRQTAEPLASHLSLLINPLIGLREQHFGELEGRTLSSVKEEMPDLWETWLLFQADFAVPGGESVRQFSVRVLSTVFGLADRHPGQRLLLVAHGGVLDMLYRHARGFSLDGPRICSIPNTGINRLSVDEQSIRILVWGDDAHLRV
jgi:2,3-bisphosphoglycerate-dependent phosphoglycerate mutase